MKSDLYFDECKDCEFQDCENTMICAVNKLGLAFHNLCKELPVIREFVNSYKFCGGFVRKER